LVASIQSAPTFELPNRKYHLMEGPIDGLLDDVVVDPFDRVLEESAQSSNLSWPNDRTWLVATEIDFVSTYVGASRSCIDSILRCEDIEAAEVNPGDGVAWDADVLNPAPLDP